ncbi:MAG: hypothetical protein LH472_06450 [Pyrinomonadaceae bacterium]|nr:hypothetical protein [Pyrinomonadaceae bacterium]
MKKLLLLVGVSLFLSACGMVSGGGNSDSNKSTVETGKLKVGDTVLFKLSRDGFGEGKIETIDGSRYKIPYGSSTQTVDEADVYALPKAGANANVKVGDYVIAKRGNENYWAAAEVTKADAKTVEIKTLAYKQTLNLSPEQVVAVRPAPVEEFKKVQTEKGFEEKAGSMRPKNPDGFEMKKGDKVVASWSGTNWYVGTIVGKNGEKAKIKWSGNFNDGDVDMTKIAAYPKMGSVGTPMKTGDIVLVKGTSDTSRWEFAEATSEKEVKFKDGKTRTVRGDEYILFD